MSTKARILALLESNRGKSISGEAIAGQLEVSRNAVWKAVKELKKDGYKISAVTNKGYCFGEENDILSVQGILPFLSGWDPIPPILLYNTLETTNKTAKELAISGAEHGTAVIADGQTAGRGRYDRSFYSPAGYGLYMSFVLRPEHMTFQIPTLITAFAAVSVCEAVEAATGKLPRIKWVNDLFLDGKKICGILTEAVTDFESRTMQWVVVGIGVNFCACATDFPEDLRETAGAIYPAGTPETTRNRLAAEIINRIARDVPYDETRLLEQYKKRLMMLGESVWVAGGKEPYRAVAVDVDNMGRLVIQRENGEIQTLSAGEIRVQQKD